MEDNKNERIHTSDSEYVSKSMKKSVLRSIPRLKARVRCLRLKEKIVQEKTEERKAFSQEG